MAFFLFRALAESGIYHRSFGLWDTWRDMVNLNLSTWVEDPVQQDDCHAWGAAPLYEFTLQILGVQPELPGYKRITVAPQVGELTWAKGSVATPEGIVHVDWIIKDQVFSIKIDGPDHIPLTLKLPDGTTIIYSNATNIVNKCPMTIIYS